MEVSKLTDKPHVPQHHHHQRSNNKMRSHLKKVVSASKKEGLFPKQYNVCNANMSCRRLSNDKNRMHRLAKIPFNPDPLNLSSLCDREDGTSSPVVLSPNVDRSHQYEPCIHEPIDTRDPLNLDGDINDKSLKGAAKRKKRKRRNTCGALAEPEELLLLTSNVEQSSDIGTNEPSAKKTDPHKPETKFDNSANARSKTKRERSKSVEKISSTNISIVKNPLSVGPSFNKKNCKFRYGNYIDYAGDSSRKNMVDTRLNYFTRAWFEGKKCLDVGCNTGQVTTLVAKHFSPAKIVGVDIDPNLIKIAKRKAHECTENKLSRYPISFCVTYGPILDTPLDGKRNEFPGNLFFHVENFVPPSAEHLESLKPEYDCILCLNVTKWVQLNYGDSGLKLLFKKMFLLLQPGGKLILEPQPYNSYKKKKNMVYDMWTNFTAMKLMPADFVSHLLSNEVGFSRSESLVYTDNRKAGYDQPIYLLTK